MSKQKDEDDLESVRKQAREEMANLARLYSIRAKDNPNYRIAYAEIEKQLRSSNQVCELAS
jgi:hypothetical protein